MAQDRRLPPMTALHAFNAVGLAGGFQGAARALSVTPSAISHQIRSLEEWLGRRLFTRAARQVHLTHEGRLLLGVVSRSFDQIRVECERIRGKPRKGITIRISALPLFTSVWLIPRLERFERQFPDVVLDIDTTNRLVDLTYENIDLAIRNTRKPTVGLSHRKLLGTYFTPLCTERLQQQLRAPEDLVRQTLIHISARPESWSEWLNSVGCTDLKPKRDLSFDSMPAALDAAVRGRGIILGMEPIVSEAPAVRHLVRPFPHRVSGESSYYLVFRKAGLARAKVRACVNWLLGEMSVYKKSLRDISRPDAFTTLGQS
jgi:LysR family transcriptional regulator, glycine cleavage system transcriptional activator